MISFKSMLAILVTILVIDYVCGHGMLMDPVNRASRWRFDSTAPVNWDDDGLYCGGMFVQHGSNGGRCGLCGDNWQHPQPRMHEHGGPYGQGVIVKEYRRGQVIDVISRLTVNHNRGQFFFNICNMDAEGESDACFAKYPIPTVDGEPFYQVPDRSSRDFHHQMKLPDNLTCRHCVVQWTYVAANNWGQCGNGTGATGCGPQENFRTCSDISIV